MRSFYLLLLIVAFVGCGELENPRQKTFSLPCTKPTKISEYRAASALKVLKKINKKNKKKSQKKAIKSKVIRAKKAKKRAVKPVILTKATENLINQGLTQDIIDRSAKYKQNVSTHKSGLIGFKEVGSYIEDGCLTKMHKKEYKLSWLYIHIDCKGNKTKYHKDKKDG